MRSTAQFDNLEITLPYPPRGPYARLRNHGPEAFNEWSAGYLPGHLGVEAVSVELRRVICRATVKKELMAPHGFLHGGSLVAIADTACGYGTIANLPPSATGFVTIELKTNFLGTSR